MIELASHVRSDYVDRVSLRFSTTTTTTTTADSGTVVVRIG